MSLATDIPADTLNRTEIPMVKTLSRIQAFMKLEASAGLILMGVALTAMLAANSPLAALYDGVLGTNIRVGDRQF